MIVNHYKREFEGEKGLVSLEVQESDLSGVSVKMLIRYADNRPDKARHFQPEANFEMVCRRLDVDFDAEVRAL